MYAIGDFIEHVYDLYGEGGAYGLDATRAQILQAIGKYMEINEDELQGDAYDLENVREILRSEHGCSKAYLC
jgi:hypothetical protein